MKEVLRRYIHYQHSFLVGLPRSGVQVFFFSGPLSSILQETGKGVLIQEYFWHTLLKQRTFHPLLTPALSPPKGRRAPTVRIVYFLLSWKAKVLLPLQGVTNIHQRKKWPIKAVKLVLFLLHKSTSFSIYKMMGLEKDIHQAVHWFDWLHFPKYFIICSYK